MSEEDRRRYLVESLFLNYNTYESEMLDAYVRRLTARKKGRGRAAGGGAVRRPLVALVLVALAALSAAAVARAGEADGAADPRRAGGASTSASALPGQDAAQGVPHPQLRRRRRW